MTGNGDLEPLEYASTGGEGSEPRYGDFLLVDLLRPDWAHFFTRYRTDVLGFLVVSAIIILIILGTYWLAMVGAAEAQQAVGVVGS